MYVAMNRFRVALGKEQDFINVWKDRDSHLETVPGFKEFNLLQGATTEEYTQFASHAIWESEQSFIDWTKSEAFRLAHKNAGGNRDLYVGPPQFEGFNAVI